MSNAARQYAPPVVKDYGDVWEITATAHPVLGTAAHGDLSFSNPASPNSPGSGVGPGVTTPQPGHGMHQVATNNIGGTVTGSNPPAGGTSGTGTSGTSHAGGSTGGSAPSGGGSSGGGGGGGTLPFTGLAVGALAAVGSALAAAGGSLRRLARRPKR